MECWREIPSLPGYFVSDLGRVQGPRRMLRLLVNIDGYRTFSVRRGREGRSFNIRVCRAALEAFVGPAPNGFEASHDDHDRTNDRLCNLRWTSREENERLKDLANRRPIGERHIQSKLTDEQFQRIQFELTRGVSMTTLATQFGVTVQAISQRLKRKRNREARGVEGRSEA